MKKIIFLLGFIGLLLVACSTEKSQTAEAPVSYAYRAPTSAEGKACLARCETSRSTCQRHCVADQSQCTRRAESRADRLYQEYLAQTQLENVPAEKSRSAFLDDTQCKLQACECDKDYRACFQLCGGQLIPQRG